MTATVKEVPGVLGLTVNWPKNDGSITTFEEITFDPGYRNRSLGGISAHVDQVEKDGEDVLSNGNDLHIYLCI